MKTTTQKAKETEKEIYKQLETIKKQVEKFVNTNSIDWSLVGSLNHISDSLNEISKFINVR